ncbi:MAG: flagellar biosynthetic protein FliO [Treponemataceae bacterium]
MIEYFTLEFRIKKLFVFFTMIYSVSFCFAQENITQLQPQNAEESFIIGAESPSLANTPVQENSLWLFIRLILVLGIVIAVIYGLVFLLKKGMSPRFQENPFLKQLSTLPVGANRSIQVVSVGNQAFLIGVSESNIQLLGEISDKDLIDSMILSASAEPTGKRRDFSSILNAIIPSLKMQSPLDETLKKTTDNAEDFLRKNQERLERLGKEASTTDETRATSEIRNDINVRGEDR